MKCSKCGQEFEGKFCPNCGEPADGSPKSSNVSAPPAGSATVPAIIGKLYAHMPKIFSILFAVFAVVMLICYAGPVTKSELLEAFGESDSVYYYLSESGEESTESWEEELSLSAEDDLDLGEEGGSGVSEYSLCAALVAFGVIAAVFAAIGLAFALYVPLAATKFKVGDRTFKVKSIFDIASLVLLFVIFLLGCILCANVGDDLGLSEPGAAPICIIFFSLFFGLLMTSALFGRKLISLVWSGAKDEYEAQKEAARAKLTAPMEPAEMGNSIKPSEYITPAEVDESLTDDEKNKISKFVKIRQIVAYIIFLPYLLIIGSVIAIAHYASRSKLNFWQVRERITIIVAIVVSLISVLMQILGLLFGTGAGRAVYVYSIYSQSYISSSYGSRRDEPMRGSDGKPVFSVADCNDVQILGGIEQYSDFGVIYTQNIYFLMFPSMYNAKPVEFKGNDLKVAKKYEALIQQIRSQYKSGVSDEILLSEIADNRDVIDDYGKLYEKITRLGYSTPWSLELIAKLALFVLSIVLLVKSNKYTERVFGKKRVKIKPVKKDKDVYKAELKAYREYRKDCYNYWIDKAYYEEGIARKRSA